MRLLALTTLLLISSFPGPTISRIVQVLHLMRHGARQIIKRQESEKLSSDAQLTNEGFRQQIKLGGEMRRNYARELEIKQYRPGEFVAISSERDRCYHSAKGFMYGFFYKGRRGSMHSHYIGRYKGEFFKDPEVAADLQRYNIRKLRPEENQMFRAHSVKVCPGIGEYIDPEGYKKDRELREYVAVIDAKLKEEGFDLEEVLGTKDLEIGRLPYLYDYLYSKFFWNKDVVEKPVSVPLFKMIKTAKTFGWYGKRKAHPDLEIFAATPIFRSIRKFLMWRRREIEKPAPKSGRSKKRAPKYVLYSGQDNVLFSMLNAFDIANKACLGKIIRGRALPRQSDNKCVLFPKFADGLVVELDVDEQGHFEASLLHNSRVVLKEPLDRFLNLIQGKESESFSQMCFGEEGDSEMEDEGLGLLHGVEEIPQKAKSPEPENSGVKGPKKYNRIFGGLVKWLEGIFGVRNVELGGFGIFCLCLLYSFKNIYGKYSERRKIKQFKQRKRK